MNESKTLAMAGAGLGALLAARALGRLWREPYSFRNKAVVITGGSRGLGLVLARMLAEEGARLTLVARDKEELGRAIRDVASYGGSVLGCPCDMRDEAQARSAIQRTVEQYGRIDVLINVAGIIQGGPHDHMTLADYEETMATHMWACLYTIRAALPYMRRQGGGRIVNIASIGGLVAIPHLLPYCTSKFALVGLSDGLRVELAEDNIRVTTVCPGLMRTGSHLQALIKGRHRKEFAVFAITNSLPIFSTDARKAARQIIEACRRGDARLIITVQARALYLMHVLFPNTTSRLLALGNRLLPGPTGDEGDISRKGWESQSRWAPSPLTHLADEAAVRNNETDGFQQVR